ncbi:MAG: hypothetical protein Q9M48_01465 [Rhodobacterales bacterium]|nr:hypothetical protein [Rhodobacterales bacterium]
MIDERDLLRQVARLEDLLFEKLGTRGKTLTKRLKHAGRRLPRRLRQAGKVITDAQGLIGHPKLARQIDEVKLASAFATFSAHLDTIDPADRRKGMALNLLGSLALNLLAVSALFLGVLRWRGLL